MKAVNFSIQLFKGKELSDGTHPIVAMTTVDRVVKKIYLTRLRPDDPNPSVRPADWDNEVRRVKRGHKDRKRINEIIEHFEVKGRAIITRILALGEAFDHERFKGELLLSEEQRRAHKHSRTDVFAMFNTVIAEMEKDGRPGTATAYKDAMSSLRLFQCNGDKEKARRTQTPMPFSAVTSIAGVKAWASFMIERGNKEVSAGIRLRALRAILYRARSERIIEFDDIPFKNVWNPGGLKISTYRAELSPIPLAETETAALLNAKPEEQAATWAVDMYRLLILTFGPNLADLAMLTKENVRTGRIHYRRLKSWRTQEEPVEVSIRITPEIADILQRYQGQSPYLLPILGPQHETAKQRKHAIQRAARLINKELVKMAQAFGLESHVTTKTARYTVATMLKNLGVAPDVINELQGRANAGILKHYAPAHRYKVLDDAQERLWALATRSQPEVRKGSRSRIPPSDLPTFQQLTQQEEPQAL